MHRRSQYDGIFTIGESDNSNPDQVNSYSNEDLLQIKLFQRNIKFKS